MNIEKTKNYLQFKHADDQRTMKPAHVTKIKKSMKKWGFLESKPVTVYQDGVDLRVIDGHHRLQAAIDLGIPVVYLVVKKSEREAMVDQNALMLKWSFKDYCTTWLQRGKLDYGKVLSYGEIIPIRMAATLLYGSTNEEASGVNAAIINGTFKVNSTHTIDMLMRIIDRVPEHQKPVVSSRAFVACYTKCMAIKEFSSSQLLDRILENPTMLQKTSQESVMLDQIDTIYNHRSRPKIPLAHMVRESGLAAWKR